MEVEDEEKLHLTNEKEETNRTYNSLCLIESLIYKNLENKLLVIKISSTVKCAHFFK